MNKTRKDPRAVGLGRRGGIRRMANMTKEERSLLGKYAALRRDRKIEPGMFQEFKALHKAVNSNELPVRIRRNDADGGQTLG